MEMFVLMKKLSAIYFLILVTILTGISIEVSAQIFDAKGLLQLAEDQRLSKREKEQSLHKFLPIYYQQANLEASQVVGNVDLWSEGNAGLNLSGNGIMIGYWDASQPRLTHQEFSGRVTFEDADTGSNKAHATQMVGTMIATGVVANARGMANSATVKSWNWDNDLSEMATEAANGLIISEHPYANSAGWITNSSCGSGWTWYSLPSVNNSKAYQFGYYDEQAELWDSVTYMAPNYLTVKAAGNLRGTDPGSQPLKHWTFNENFECIQDSTSVREVNGGIEGLETLTSASISKNVLVVGAVTSSAGNFDDLTSVTPISKSGFGPTDDGRIKPDIMAPTNLFTSSSVSDSDYSTGAGTSAASAVLAGSVALLREHYQDMKSDTLSAASIKGILVHTADDIGNKGPDYKTGWGLLNTERAARFLSANQSNSELAMLIDTLITDGGSIQISYSNNSKRSLKFTITWTDPPGTQPINANDVTDKMLVHDIDVSIFDSNLETYLPWFLDPNSPNNAATTGDNSIDNIEQVYISDAEIGNYSINISHKGILSALGQRLSILVSSSEPEVEFESVSSGNWKSASTWNQSTFPTTSFHRAILKHAVTLDGDQSLRTLDFNTESANLTLNSNRLEIFDGVTGSHVEFVGDTASTLRMSGWENKSDSIKFKSGSEFLKTFIIDTESDSVYLSGRLQIHDSLYLKTGTLNTQGASLVLVSDSTKSALFQKGTGAIEGALSYSRSFDFPESGWRIISSPFLGSMFSDLNSSFFTQGGAWADEVVGLPNSSLWMFDLDAQNFKDYYGADSTFSSGIGYLFFMFDSEPGGDQILPVSQTFSGLEPDSVIINLYRGVNDQASYNLMGNPFTGTLDWHQVLIDSQNLRSSYAVWDPSQTNSGGSSGFKYYNQADGIGDAGRYIAPMQGFFVQADTSSAIIRFRQNQKSAENPVRYGKVRNAESSNINLIIKNEQGEIIDNQAHLIFSSNAGTGFDASDVHRLRSLNGEENTLSFLGPDGEMLVFEGRSNDAEEDKITLILEMTETGWYELDWSKMVLIPEDWKLLLIDHISNAKWDMRNSGSLEFYHDPKIENSESRFSILINRNSIVNADKQKSRLSFQLKQNYPNPFNPQTSISYQLEQSGNVRMEVFDITGRLVAILVDEVQNPGYYTKRFNASNLSSGVYFYRIKTGNFVQTRAMMIVK